VTTPPPLDIQPLSAADAPRLAAVALQAYRDHYLHLWHDHGAWYTQTCFTVERLTAELRDPICRFFLIYSGPAPVGFLKLNVEPPARSRLPSAYVPPADALELERIYFVREATGQGLGSAVMRFVDDYARQHNHPFVWLKAMDSSTSALAFYRKHGFETVATHRLAFSQMKAEYRGMVILAKSVA